MIPDTYSESSHGGQERAPSAEALVEMPPSFSRVIFDMATDLSLTFPEYSMLWSRWMREDVSVSELRSLFEHCVRVYPARFFDILNKNADIFSPESGVDTEFLPGVQFRTLFCAKGVSDNTRAALWKYLQLVLFTVSAAIPDRESFGKAFEGVDPAELQKHLAEAIRGVNEFFEEASSSSSSSTDEAAGGATKKTAATDMPNAKDLNDHLNDLFEGKIGELAKELAEDISGDFAALLGEGGDANSAEILKKLMADPSKMMELVKTIGGKITAKMEKGEISHEELVKEAEALMSKMQSLGGEKFKDMFSMLSGLPGMSKMRPPRPPGGAEKGGGAASGSMRDRLRARMAQKQAARAPQPVVNATLQATEDAHKFIYSEDGAEKQAVSAAPQKAKKHKKGKK